MHSGNVLLPCHRHKESFAKLSAYSLNRFGLPFLLIQLRPLDYKREFVCHIST